MIVLDASVIIAVGDPHDPHSDRSAEILERDGQLALHPMTLAESMVGPMRAGQDELLLAYLRRVGVETTAPPADEWRRLARLRIDTGLKLPDCCVISAAIDERADLATFDRRLATAAERVGVRVIS